MLKDGARPLRWASQLPGKTEQGGSEWTHEVVCSRKHGERRRDVAKFSG